MVASNADSIPSAAAWAVIAPRAQRGRTVVPVHAWAGIPPTADSAILRVLPNACSRTAWARFAPTANGAFRRQYSDEHSQPFWARIAPAPHVAAQRLPPSRTALAEMAPTAHRAIRWVSQNNGQESRPHLTRPFCGNCRPIVPVLYGQVLRPLRVASLVSNTRINDPSLLGRESRPQWAVACMGWNRAHSSQGPSAGIASHMGAHTQ